MFACLLACLDQPLTVNFKWAHSNISQRSWWRLIRVKGYCLTVALVWKRPGVKMTWAECVCSTHGNFQINLFALWVRPSCDKAQCESQMAECVVASLNDKLDSSYTGISPARLAHACVVLVAPPAGRIAALSACMVTYMCTLWAFSYQICLTIYLLRLTPRWCCISLVSSSGEAMNTTCVSMVLCYKHSQVHPNSHQPLK